MHPSPAAYWFLFAAVALLTTAGFLLVTGYARLERRAAAIDDAARRAHLRLDDHQRQLSALGHELGWVDDRAFTRVVTGPIPEAAQRPTSKTSPTPGKTG